MVLHMAVQIVSCIILVDVFIPGIQGCKRELSRERERERESSKVFVNCELSRERALNCPKKAKRI